MPREVDICIIHAEVSAEALVEQLSSKGVNYKFTISEVPGVDLLGVIGAVVRRPTNCEIEAIKNAFLSLKLFRPYMATLTLLACDGSVEDVIKK